MKKIISMVVLFVMMGLLATTVVNAATSKTLAGDLYSIGAQYGMTSSDKARIERYLTDSPATDEQANQVLAKAEEADAIMKEAGTTDYTKLTAEQKNRLKILANEAASILGLTLTFTDGKVNVYKDGKLVDVMGSTQGGKLAYTGNNTGVVLVVSSVAVVALAAGFVVRKKIANA